MYKQTCPQFNGKDQQEKIYAIVKIVSENITTVKTIASYSN